MLPYISIAGWEIPLWGVFVNLACLAAIFGSLHEARGSGVSSKTLLGMWPWTLLGGFLGAHAYHLLAAPHESVAKGALDLVNVFRGTAVQGGIAGGAAASAVFLRVRRQAILPVFDLCAPAGALAQGIARLGCFAAGCCYGAPSRVGVSFRRPLSDAPVGVPLHPAQLYEAALCAVLAVWLHAELKASAPDGRVFALYLGGYGVIRFLVQFWRGDDAGHLLAGLSHSQYAGLAMAGLSLVLAGRWGVWRRTVA